VEKDAAMGAVFGFESAQPRHDPFDRTQCGDWGRVGSEMAGTPAAKCPNEYFSHADVNSHLHRLVSSVLDVA
jgi:hypothetical protein